MSATLEPLRAAIDHLVALKRVGHPGGGAAGAKSVAAIREGADPVTALADAGAPSDVVAFVREAKPGDLPAALERVTAAVGRVAARRRAFGDAALHPFVLAGAATFLSVVVLGGLRPAMSAVSDLSSRSSPLWPAPLALLAGIALLVLLGASMRSARPRFPFVAARRRHERALVLSIATAAIDGGAAIPIALRAAGRFSVDPMVRGGADALADDLDRGASSAGSADLLGPLGGALFASAAAQGGAPAVLAAIAELHESAADADLPIQLLRAEVATLALGGGAIALAAIAFARIYTGPLAQ